MNTLMAMQMYEMVRVYECSVAAEEESIRPPVDLLINCIMYFAHEKQGYSRAVTPATAQIE